MWRKVAALSEVRPGDVIEAEVEGVTYAICNVNGEIRAVEGVCPHAGGPLGMGALESGILTCPFHAWQFDTSTGFCLLDDTVKIATYPVRVDAGEIWADLPESDPGTGAGPHA